MNGTSTIATISEELPRKGVDVRFSDHGLSHSIYLHDPDRHQIELTTYHV